MAGDGCLAGKVTLPSWTKGSDNRTNATVFEFGYINAFIAHWLLSCPVAQYGFPVGDLIFPGFPAIAGIIVVEIFPVNGETLAFTVGLNLFTSGERKGCGVFGRLVRHTTTTFSF